MKRRFSALLCVFFILFGGVFVFVSHVIKNSHEKMMKACDVTVTGTVIENKLEYNDETESYHPVFRYEYNGKTYSERYSVGSSPPDYKVGETKELMISSADPTKFFVKGDKSFKLFEWVFSIAGWLVIGFGVIYPLIQKVFIARNGFSDDEEDDELPEEI